MQGEVHPGLTVQAQGNGRVDEPEGSRRNMTLVLLGVNDPEANRIFVEGREGEGVGVRADHNLFEL